MITPKNVSIKQAKRAITLNALFFIEKNCTGKNLRTNTYLYMSKDI